MNNSTDTLEKYINTYPMLEYIKENHGQYRRAKDAGYKDPNDFFMIGESGGFLLDIRVGDKFVNTNLLTEMANIYHINGGKYTLYKEDSIPHRQLRKREEYRRSHGFDAPCFMREGKVQNLHISGDMYNYLNYTVIEQLDEKTIIHTDKGSVAKKKQDFPKFIDAQFWTFAIIEFCELNGFHLLIDKTRRGGFSYIMSAHSANKINLQPNKVCIHVAADSKYLTTTLILIVFRHIL